jgi:hypothetical protein
MSEGIAGKFANMMVKHHKADLRSDDKELRNAIVVKTVALVVLAFDIPATDCGVDHEEALVKLRNALGEISRRRADTTEQRTNDD